MAASARPMGEPARQGACARRIAPRGAQYPWASADSTSWTGGHKHWQNGSPEEAAQNIYWPALRYAWLEHDVQKARPSVEFHFHLATSTNQWHLPALFAVHHRGALASYVDLQSQTHLKRLR